MLGLCEAVENLQQHRISATCNSGAELYRIEKDIFVSILGKQTTLWQALERKCKKIIKKHSESVGNMVEARLFVLENLKNGKEESPKFKQK